MLKQRDEGYGPCHPWIVPKQGNSTCGSCHQWATPKQLRPGHGPAQPPCQVYFLPSTQLQLPPTLQNCSPWAVVALVDIRVRADQDTDKPEIAADNHFPEEEEAVYTHISEGAAALDSTSSACCRFGRRQQIKVS